MKTLFRMMALFLLLFGFSACSDDDEVVTEQPLTVNYANLSGTWKLTEWNGQPLADDTYCYITFVRKDHTYLMYQKFDSMYARLITGTFTIEEDDYLGYLISGTYDYGRGDWSSTYIVNDLYSSSMTWIVEDDASDVSKYERCDSVPEDIVNEARPQ
ncbi:MAG: lipocalin family protein [Bacteroides sp.]|nr:lipocalin family protein [Bacteroides sp.]